MHYDRIVSLGNNCEVAFQLRRVLGQDISGFFNWNVTRVSSLTSILNSRFDNLLCEGNLENFPEKGLMLDRAYGHEVHSDFKSKEIRTEPSYQEMISGMREKMNYLVSKFISEALTSERTLYVYKTEEALRPLEEAMAIYSSLAIYHADTSFSLVFLQDLSKAEPQWQVENIFNRYLARFAPWSDAPDGHVPSWDRVLSEFPYKHKLRLAGY